MSLLAACGGGRTIAPTPEPQPVVRSVQLGSGPTVRVHVPELVVSETEPQIGADAPHQDQHALPDPGSAAQAHVPEPVVSETAPVFGAADPHQGHYALPGIGRIPHGDLKLATWEIARSVLIVDGPHDQDDPLYVQFSMTHLSLMVTVACGAYVIACVDPSDSDRLLAGWFVPGERDAVEARTRKIARAKERGPKIVSHSIGPFVAGLDAGSNSQPLPFALVQATGNEGLDSVFSWDGLEPRDPVPSDFQYETFRYDPALDMLVFVKDSTDPIYQDETFRVGDRLDRASVQTDHTRELLSSFRNIRWAVTNDQVIYTAGYTIDSQGREVRHPGSNDCVGVEEACVWVPFQILVHEIGYDQRLAGFRTGFPVALQAGTSFGPPRVAMAMASMLSVYPDLSPTNLVFLTRACARPVAGLSGNGIADFTCLLNIGEDGVVSVKDADDLGLPDIITPLSLPGELMVATRLVDRQGRESPFRKLVPAAPMTHRSGLALTGADTPEVFQKGFPPQFRLAIREDIDLFGIQESERPGLGFAWRRGPLFAAIGHSVRDRFFGFAGGGGAWNFRGTREIGVNLGHDNLHLRFTNQRTRSRAELEGNSLGITARKEFGLRGDWRLGVLAEVDRFLGGKARIPGMGGTAKISEGKPGYRGEIRLTRHF